MKLAPATTFKAIVGRIWLTDGRVLDFEWYDKFFAAKAFYSRKQQIKQAIHSNWGNRPCRTW